MNNDDRVNESLSALADSECDELESARVLKTLRGSAALRKRWEDIHTVRAALRGERCDLLSGDFADKVSRTLDNEAHMLVPERPGSSARAVRSWRRPVAGLAIAASVAALSIFALQSLQNEAPGPQQVVDGSVWIAPPSVATVGASGTRWNVQRAELEQRLNNYLLNHMEYATMGEMQGMLPYSRLAGYDRVPTQ
ncbi:MAG: RseA family anti-sigma factor [Gammaproteobacteria bacterium]|nr:RseA family anti-sigma factor [Gammaproteobacteria bacterium]